MSFWYEDAALPSNFTAAGGVAGLGEIDAAAQKQMELVDNTNSRYTALSKAYDDRIAAIRAATGQAVENPLKLAEQDDFQRMQQPRVPIWRMDMYAELKDGPAMPTSTQKRAQAFSTWLSDMEQRFPEAKSAIRADVPIERDAEQLAARSDEELARLMDSRGGVMKYGAALWGGLKGTFNDPIQVASMTFGAGPAAGRTAVTRIASMALKNALINGAVEASLQPGVQDWRRQAGLPNGFTVAATNVLFAAAAGGVLGGGAEAVATAGRRIFRGADLDRMAAHAAETAPLTPEVRAALAGDTARAAEVLAPIRDALPAEARGALDQQEILGAVSRQIEGAGDPANAQRNADRALTAASRTDATFEPVLDRAKIDRIAAELVPDAPPARKADGPDLTDFLIRAGGLKDQKGEISALGLQNMSVRFAGRLVRDDGMALDRARLVAAEAGYFNHLYGTPDAAMEKSTVADLLDELDTASRRTDGPAEDDGGRGYVAGRVEDLMRMVGPDIDDALIRDAVQLAEADGIDLLAAFDRVAIAAEFPEGLPVPAGRAGETGFSSAANVRDFVGASPARTLDDLYAVAEARQAELDVVAREIGVRLGLDWKNPGIKNMAAAAEKMVRKSYSDTRQMTDVVRGGFVVSVPAEADAVARVLSNAFSVFDEGWKITPAGYFDRKILIRFSDGTVGEVQVWHSEMLRAKDSAGHRLYEDMRKLAPDDARRVQLLEEQNALYAAVTSALSTEWRRAVVEGSGGRPGNRSRNASSVMADPESTTSGIDTGVHSAPRSSTANANPPSITAGRASQSTNISDTGMLGSYENTVRGLRGNVNSENEIPGDLPGREPDAIDEAELFTPADLDDMDPDMDIPFFDDGPPSRGAEIVDDLEELNMLFQVTEACKT